MGEINVGIILTHRGLLYRAERKTKGQAVAVAQRDRARKPRARHTCWPGQSAIPMMMLMFFQKQ
jgi:hypothetical protein